jgi:NAD(P)-dependent dehydrogenase (short-subunit alcohol dehydrogenase family)
MVSRPSIIVTGAAGGIGSETVRILLSECGARLVATDVVSSSMLDALKEKHPKDLEIFLGDIIAVRISPRPILAIADPSCRQKPQRQPSISL